MHILIVVAHPDDETMLTGGTLAMIAKAGADVHILCATRGEGGDIGHPPIYTREDVGAVREREMNCAVKALGGTSLHFMGYIDPLVGENDELYAFAGNEGEVAGKIIQKIQGLNIDVVITHGRNGEYGHAAHLKVYTCTLLALMSLPENERPLLYSFQGAFAGHPKERVMNQDMPAHIVLDIKTVEAQKLAAITCHATQHGLFLRNAIPDENGHTSLKFALMPLESLHRVYPEVETFPIRDKLVELLLGKDGVRILDEISIPEESSPAHH